MITDETIKELILGLEEAKGFGNLDIEIADQEIECLNELIEARQQVKEWRILCGRFADDALVGRVANMNVYKALLEKYKE